MIGYALWTCKCPGLGTGSILLTGKHNARGFAVKNFDERPHRGQRVLRQSQDRGKANANANVYAWSTAKLTPAYTSIVTVSLLLVVQAVSSKNTVDVRLFIKRIQVHHFRSYGLSATNALGKSSHRIELVQSEPQVYFPVCKADHTVI